MWKFVIVYILLCTNAASVSAQVPRPVEPATTVTGKIQFVATAELLDAVVNSISALVSLVKKESYRNKIASFNNPASSDLGFSLETELQQALKPLMGKARNTNVTKFSSIASFLVNNPIKNQLVNPAFSPTGVFNSLLGLVGNRQDLDSFSMCMTRYFVQYERLDLANKKFRQNMDKLVSKLVELQFDTREYMLDITAVLYKDTLRQRLQDKSMEEIMLRFLSKRLIEKVFLHVGSARYPGDGIKTAKEIVYGIQKLFNDYLEIYTENFREINQVLLQSKDLGRNINMAQVDASAKSLLELYNDSKEADMLNIRMNTLIERLRILSATEQEMKAIEF